MEGPVGFVKRFLGGLYAWSLSAFFGAVLLDVAYSHLIQAPNGSPLDSALLQQVSDLLLLMGAVMLLAGLSAIAASWHVPVARDLFALSLFVVGFTEFLLPVLLTPILSTSSGSFIIGLGPLIRLLPMALASAIAIAGLRWQFRAA